jgi:DNA-binding PadR family transcriptional regulator
LKYKGELNGIVLGVLQAGPAHGYEVAKRIKTVSEGTLAVGEAKLYPCLHKLEQDGLVAAEWIPQTGKPSRKVYSLTDKGRGALAEKLTAWEQFSGAVTSVLGHKRESHHG